MLTNIKTKSSWLIALAFLSCSCVASPTLNNSKLLDSVKKSETAPEIIVTVLGSGTPVPSATQFGAAMLVQAGGKNMMFDCGRGCTTRLAQLDKNLITKVDHLFVTHMHSDHLMGIDDLWLNGWVQGRKVPLKTWGPEGTNEMMEGIRSTFKRDIAFRKADNVPAPSAGLDNAFTDLPFEGGVIIDEDGLKVSAFLVNHASIIPAYGYKIEYKGRSVVISGDTTVAKSLYEQGQDADVLMLEVLSPYIIDYLHAIFDDKQANKVISYHLTAEQAADVFLKTQPRLGIYYHTSNGPKSKESLILETKKIFKGDFLVSHDLFQIRVGEDITTHNLLD